MKRNTLACAQYVSCLLHSTYIQSLHHRIKIRCYKIERAYGSVSGNDAFLIFLIKFFSHSLPLNQRVKNRIGLSLAYDIITKEHNGTIKVESLSAEAAAQAGKENEGATFIINLPAA